MDQIINNFHDDITRARDLLKMFTQGCSIDMNILALMIHNCQCYAMQLKNSLPYDKKSSSKLKTNDRATILKALHWLLVNGKLYNCEYDELIKKVVEL